MSTSILTRLHVRIAREASGVPIVVTGRPLLGRVMDRLYSASMLLAVIALLPVLIVKDHRRMRTEGREILDD